ncbi:glycosyltransferase family 4 protein [Paenibacillus sp. USHLN196]|uniref:glycosyltransferase family 4 protein n=1 Tax=Paenibacillus sp. USHLN196 TaxID=3081291 RepID=UPI0030191F72
MSKTFVFTSYELYPINAGGCGVFLYNAIEEILKNYRNKVILLLDMPNHECDLFKERDQPKLPNHGNLRVICLSEWISDCKLINYSNIFLEKSHRFYKGIQKLAKFESLNYVEFFDYVGIGYFTVKAKKYEDEFSEVQLGVRAHCTIDLMDIEQVPNSFDINKLQMYQMEKEAIQDADFVLVPSKAWGDIYTTRYGADRNRIVVSPPPVKKWNDVSYVITEQQNDVLFYGRIFQLKGVDMFIDAAVSFMSLRPESESRFYLVGYDGLNSNNLPYKTELLERIPEKLRHRFVFPGHLDHEQLESLLKTVRFSVFPNYVESFCYSIHEIYNLGVPIICNEIPAFKDYFRHEKNSLVYSGTSSGLLSEMMKLFDNENLRLQISNPYDVIDNGIFIESYSKIVNNNILEGSSFQQPKLLETSHSLCSLIVISDGQELDHNHKTLLEEPIIHKNKSYILFAEAPGTPIHFLGQIRYARKIDGTTDNLLEISEFVLVCYSDDVIDPRYLTESIKVLTMTPELKYVGAQFTNREHYNQYSLLEPNTYWDHTVLTRAVIKMDGNKNTVRDIYDIRFRELGEKKILGQKGYILPRDYITIGKHVNIRVHDGSYIFTTHRNSGSYEWNPYVLYPFLLKQDFILKSKPVHQKQQYYFMRKNYHKLKHRIDEMKGVKGKYLSLLLNLLHRQLKKRF